MKSCFTHQYSITKLQVHPLNSRETVLFESPYGRHFMNSVLKLNSFWNTVNSEFFRENIVFANIHEFAASRK